MTGVWIDCERKFKDRIRIKIAAERMLAATIGRLRKETKGMGIGKTRKMYIAGGRTTMEYGRRVW